MTNVQTSPTVRNRSSETLFSRNAASRFPPKVAANARSPAAIPSAQGPPNISWALIRPLEMGGGHVDRAIEHRQPRRHHPRHTLQRPIAGLLAELDRLRRPSGRSIGATDIEARHTPPTSRAGARTSGGVTSEQASARSSQRYPSSARPACHQNQPVYPAVA